MTQQARETPLKLPKSLLRTESPRQLPGPRTRQSWEIGGLFKGVQNSTASGRLFLCQTPRRCSFRQIILTGCTAIHLPRPMAFKTGARVWASGRMVNDAVIKDGSILNIPLCSLDSRMTMAHWFVLIRRARRVRNSVRP